MPVKIVKDKILNHPKFQVNGIFEIPAQTWHEALEILRQCPLKGISINIYEVIILNNDTKENISCL